LSIPIKKSRTWVNSCKLFSTWVRHFSTWVNSRSTGMRKNKWEKSNSQTSNLLQKLSKHL